MLNTDRKFPLRETTVGEQLERDDPEHHEEEPGV
jgi:hypothetical protein